MSGIAILCSGQGAQGPGMFDLLADSAEAAPVFAAAATMLGKDPRALVQEASGDALHANTMGQILCCTQAMASWAVLAGSVPRPFVAAGYSIGELAAWGVAGLLDAEQILGLAAKRAAMMDQATTEPSGLAAVRGLSKQELQSICNANGAYVAIMNSSDHFVVGGTRQSLAAVVAEAETHGARQTTLLPVAVPSHTPLLSQASEQFRDALGRVKTAGEIPSGVRLLSSIDGSAVFDPEAGLDKLALQIQQTVDWAACMEECKAAAVTKVFELGPGSALVRMMQAAMPGSDAHSLSEFRSLSGVRQWLNR